MKLNEESLGFGPLVGQKSNLKIRLWVLGNSDEHFSLFFFEHFMAEPEVPKDIQLDGKNWNVMVDPIAL